MAGQTPAGSGYVSCEARGDLGLAYGYLLVCLLRLYRQNVIKERMANEAPIILDRIIWLEPLFVCELLPVSGVFAVVSVVSVVFVSF